MQRVHKLSGQASGSYYTTGRFYMPSQHGEGPIPVSLPIKSAQTVLWKAASILRHLRENVTPELRPVHNNTVVQMLEPFARLCNVVPFGTIYVGGADHDPNNAGYCIPILRRVVMHPEKINRLPEVVHELAHLSAVGPTDDLMILVHPETGEFQSFTMPTHGWKRYATSVFNDGDSWNFSAPSVVWGFFFEEAMAELVELSITFEEDGEYDQPVTFRGKELIFTIPTGYGHNVAAWGVMQLKRYCPGITGILLEGVKGKGSYRQLQSVMDGTFPGLFDQLYAVSKEEGLAVGTEHILKAING